MLMAASTYCSDFLLLAFLFVCHQGKTLKMLRGAIKAQRAICLIVHLDKRTNGRTKQSPRLKHHRWFLVAERGAKVEVESPKKTRLASKCNLNYDRQTDRLTDQQTN